MSLPPGRLLEIGLCLGLMLMNTATGSASSGSLYYDHTGGTAFEGIGHGQCRAEAVGLAASSAAGISFERAFWTQHTVKMNFTQTTSGQSVRRTALHHSYNNDTGELGAASGELQFGENGTGWIVLPPAIAGSVQASRVSFVADSFLFGPPEAGFLAYELYGHHPLGLDATRVEVPPGLRRFQSQEASATLNGSLTLYLENAVLSTKDGLMQTPQRERVALLVGSPAAAQFGQMTISYATLRLINATIDFLPSSAQVFCSGAEAELEGNLTAYRATGSFHAQNQTKEFERAELSVTGTFHWAETNQRSAKSGAIEGDFAAVGLDFVDSGFVPAEPTIWVEIGLWSLILATLSSLLFFAVKFSLPLFTRLTETSIQGHTSRALVLDLVRQTPNINFHTLVASSKLNKSVVRYHVRVLEVGGFLRSHRVHRDRCFVSKDTIQKLGRAALAPSVDVLVRNDPVLGAILTGLPPEGIRMNQLLLRVCESMGVSRPGAWKAVLRTERKGQVRIERNGKEAWVHLVASSTG